MERDNNHEKKMIAPILITILIVFYYAAVVFVCMFLPIPFLAKCFIALFPMALAGVAIAMFRERIYEIRSGEEDDLSQY